MTKTNRAPNGSMYCSRGHRKITNSKGKNVCYECQKEASKRYYNKNSKEIKKSKKASYGIHKEKYGHLVTAWRKDNAEYWNDYLNKYNNNRYHTNLQDKLVKLLRTRTGHAIRRYMSSGKIPSRGTKHISYGYEIDYGAIINHLFHEAILPADFYEIGYKMGGYNLDHIVPLRSFDLTDPREWKMATHPANHRWLLAKDNYDRYWDLSDENLNEIMIVRSLLEDAVVNGG